MSLWGLRRLCVRGQHRCAVKSLAQRLGRGLRAGRMHEGFAGDLGEPKASLGMRPRKQRVRPVKQHPGVDAAISPRRRANGGNQPEVMRRNATNGVTQEKPGSLNRFIVPRGTLANGFRRSRSVGKEADWSWCGGGETGVVHSDHNTCKQNRLRCVSEPMGAAMIGRTVCVSCARTGLWGSRRETAGSTRKSIAAGTERAVHGPNARQNWGRGSP